MKEGQLLAGKYRLEYLVGKGSFATVWAARNTFIDRTVALKILSDRSAKNPTIMERFLREAKLAARPIHPVIVAVEDLGQTAEGAPFLVLELLQGQTVAQAIKSNGAFSWLTALEIARLFLEGLGAAHELDIIHRDIKPANVFLVEPGSSAGPPVRLLDLGLARDLGEEARLTRTGQVMGTANYLAPEALLDKQPKGGAPAGDVFSCGMVLFAMLTGRLPFDPSSRKSNPALEVAAKAEMYAAGKPLPGPAEFSSELPKPIDTVVRKALELDPANRYSNAKEMLADLVQASQNAVPVTKTKEFDDLSRTLKWIPSRITSVPSPPKVPKSGAAGPVSSPTLEAYGPEEVSVVERAPAERTSRDSVATPMSWSSESLDPDLSWRPNPWKWVGVSVGIVLAILLIAGSVVGAYALRGRLNENEQPVAAVAPEGDLAASSQKTTAGKDLIRIALSGLPEGSEVTLDGHPVNGSSVSSVAGSQRILEVRAPEHEPLRLDLSFESNKTVDLAESLRRIETPEIPEAIPEPAVPTRNALTAAPPPAPAAPAVAPPSAPGSAPAVSPPWRRPPARRVVKRRPVRRPPRAVAERPSPPVKRRTPRSAFSSGIMDPWSQ